MKRMIISTHKQDENTYARNNNLNIPSDKDRNVQRNRILNKINYQQLYKSVKAINYYVFPRKIISQLI